MYLPDSHSFTLPLIAIAGWVQLAMLGASALGSYLKNRRDKKTLQSQQDVAKKQTGLSDTISAFANKQHTLAEPAISKAMQYYLRVAGGGQGARNANAPAMMGLTDTYKGAESGIMSRMGPGPNRDRAISELSRQKAGQMGMLPFMAQQGAVGQLSGMGTNIMGSANSMLGSASNPLAQAMLSSQYAQQTQQGMDDRWNKVGDAAGKWFMDWYKNRQAKGVNL